MVSSIGITASSEPPPAKRGRSKEQLNAPAQPLCLKSLGHACNFSFAETIFKTNVANVTSTSANAISYSQDFLQIQPVAPTTASLQTMKASSQTTTPSFTWKNSEDGFKTSLYKKAFQLYNRKYHCLLCGKSFVPPAKNNLFSLGRHMKDCKLKELFKTTVSARNIGTAVGPLISEWEKKVEEKRKIYSQSARDISHFLACQVNRPFLPLRSGTPQNMSISLSDVFSLSKPV